MMGQVNGYLSNSFGPQARARVSAGDWAGWLVSPATRGVPLGVRWGQPWAGDNGCFTEAWSPEAYRAWLEKMSPYQDSCLFLVAPDWLGDWMATHGRWLIWRRRLAGWRLAYVGQDRQPVDEVPWDEIVTYFVGGTDKWKDGADSLALVREARQRDKRVHIGRRNTGPRLMRFLRAYRREDELGWPDGLTFDGNGIRRPGKDRELAQAMSLCGMEMLCSTSASI